MRVSGPVSTQTSQAEMLSSLLLHHRKQDHAFALWRQPGSEEKHVLVCTEGVQELDDLLLEELQPGFAFAPFDPQKKKLFLAADLTYTFHGSEDAELDHKISDEKFRELKNELDLHSTRERIHMPAFIPPPTEDKQSFLSLVGQSIDFIQAGNAEKIVPSRSKRVDLVAGFDAIDTFERLCMLYPNAMVSLVSIPNIGTWLGATPELLASIDAKKCFKTTALAGTQVYNASIDLREVMWTQKEIEEQALVSRYIINCFKRIRLRDFKEHGPKTFIAGNLIHLKTDFEADMVATGFPQLGSQMLQLLHPTSAVCGTPLDASKEFLRTHEGYDRQFYSGFLGPVNMNNETQLFVNLRCMQLTGDHMILYAGAGVTIDSIAEKEWKETEIKMDTLLRAITS